MSAEGTPVREDALSPKQKEFLAKVRQHDPQAIVLRSGEEFYFRGPSIGEGAIPPDGQADGERN